MGTSNVCAQQFDAANYALACQRDRRGCGDRRVRRVHNLIGIGYVILVGIENVLTPHAAHAFATGGVKDLRRILLTAGAFMGLTLGGLCVFVLITGDWLATLAFGPQFHGTGEILITLGLTALVTAWSILTGNGLWAIEQPRANLVADVCGMVVTLVAAALFDFAVRCAGAALATLAGTTGRRLCEQLL